MGHSRDPDEFPEIPVREVLGFDEAARPHSNASIGIAEHGGWLYFTLSDLQSDIWVANVTGLKK